MMGALLIEKFFIRIEATYHINMIYADCLKPQWLTVFKLVDPVQLKTGQWKYFIKKNGDDVSPLTEFQFYRIASMVEDKDFLNKKEGEGNCLLTEKDFWTAFQVASMLSKEDRKALVELTRKILREI